MAARRAGEEDKLPDPGDGDHKELDVKPSLGGLGVSDQASGHPGS